MTRLPLILFLTLFLLIPFVGAQDPKTKKGPPLPDGLKALSHPDAKVRYRAAQTLADLGPLAKFALPELTELLKDKNMHVRVKAAEALWKIDKTPSVTLLPILLQAIKDKDAGVRAAVPSVIALLGVKAKPALPALVGALKDKELDVKLAAITALGEIGPIAKGTAGDLLELTADKDFPLLEPFIGAALADLGDGAIPALTVGLGHESTERCRVAAYALGTMGSSAEPAVPELAKALKRADVATRTSAVRALGKIGPTAKAALPQLEAILADKDATVRIEAALATWSISGQIKHITVLVKALDDESAAVRDRACQSLAVMKAGAKDAVDPVAKLLDDKELRLRAIMTLGEIGPAAKKAAPALKKLADDKDAETQMWSAFALWQISGDAKPTLKVLEQTLATEAHYTQSIILLGAMRDAAQSVLPTLVALYREEEVAADRKALAEAIKKIDAQAALKLGIK
jgi:HEAT repeat protein